MPYVNFKEENYQLDKQIKNRKENNKKIISQIKKDKTLLSGYSLDGEYSFKNTKKQMIGTQGVLKDEDFQVISDEDFICANFFNCKFQNIKFINCTFIGCNFKKCSFGGGGIIFENCTFVKSDSIKTPSLNVKDNLGCYFEDCYIYAQFKGSNISYSLFERCTFENTNFELSDLQAVIIIQSDLFKIVVSDCDFQNFKTQKCYMSDFEFDDKYMTTFDDKTFFDKLVERKKDRDEYEGFYMIYQNIAFQYEQNNLKSNFGEYYFLGKKAEHKTLDFLPKIKSYLYWFSCGYGERPLYSIYFSFFIIFLFTALFLLVGIDIEGDVIQYSNLKMIEGLSFGEFLKHLLRAFSLSTSLFSGVGDELCEPTIQSVILADIEMIFGVIVMGLGIGTLTRKIVR